jgi:hypothetical protein
VRNLSPTSKKYYYSSLRFKKTARASKKRATQYRERLKMAMNFDIKLRNTVLGNDAINFCLA